MGEKAHFYSIAHGSLTELQNQLLIARDIGYVTYGDYTELAELATVTQKLINGLIRSTRSRSTTSNSQLPTPGFTLVELLIALALIIVGLGTFGAVAAQLRALRHDAERGRAQAVADAILDGARAASVARAAQDAGPPLGIIVGEGAWGVVSDRIALTGTSGDARGVLPLPGNARADGTIAFTLTPPDGTGWTVTTLMRAADLAHGYALELQDNRAAIVLRNGATETTLASAALPVPPTAVRFTLTGSALRAEVDAVVLTATDATYAHGWIAWVADRAASFANVAWTDAEGTTAWPVAGTAPALPAPWEHLSTTSLPNASVRLTVEDTAAGTPALHTFTAAVTWDGRRGRETLTQSTWATY